MSVSLWLRVAVVQFAPKLGDVHANIARARELCRGLTPRSVDLVCFPEMIFSGYMFSDALSIAPYLEHPQTGPTAAFCAELAKHLQCYVVTGCPEHTEPTSSPLLPPFTRTATVSSDPSSSFDPLQVPPPPLIGANSAFMYDPAGRLLHTYHKSNLFPVDRPWARPGSGFTTLDLPAPFGRTAVAICNDLNVQQNAWISLEKGPYELAEYCKREGVKVLVLLNAWLKPEEERDRDRVADSGGNGQDEETEVDGEDEDGMEPNWDVLNYWAMRLRPLWTKAKEARVDASMKEGEGARRESDTETSAGTARARIIDPRDDDVLVVVCNRLGREQGKTFVGSSAMFAMRPDSGKPRLLQAMGEREEGVGVWAARIGPRTSLV